MGFDVFGFDWSGVISDDRKPVYEANKRVVGSFGVAIPPFDKWLDDTLKLPMDYYASLGIKGDSEELWNLYKTNFSKVCEEGLLPVVYEDVHEVLSYLKNKNKKLLVLSSHPEKNILSEAKRYDIHHYFDEIFGEVEDKVVGLKNIIDMFGYDPRQMVYFGDMVFDLQAANAVGILVAAMAGTDENRRGFHSKKQLSGEKHDFLLASLLDIKENDSFI